MNYAQELGSTLPIGSKQIVLFITDKDKNGKKLNQEYWVKEALKCFGLLFRGATAFPPGEGVWRNDEKQQELLLEKTIMVISYVNPKDLNKKNLEALRHFLHRMGRETNQGEIGIVIDGNYHGISEYDRPGKGAEDEKE